MPSALSARNRQNTPKSFFTAQCSGSGSQLLNSPISAIACKFQAKSIYISVAGVLVYLKQHTAAMR